MAFISNDFVLSARLNRVLVRERVATPDVSLHGTVTETASEIIGNLAIEKHVRDSPEPLSVRSSLTLSNVTLVERCRWFYTTPSVATGHALHLL